MSPRQPRGRPSLGAPGPAGPSALIRFPLVNHDRVRALRLATRQAHPDMAPIARAAMAASLRTWTPTLRPVGDWGSAPRYALHVPDDLLVALEARAEFHHTSLAHLAANALTTYLDRCEREDVAGGRQVEGVTVLDRELEDVL